MKSGLCEGGALMHYTCCVLQTPTDKSCSQRKEDCLLTQQQTQPTRSHDSANRKPLYFKFPVSSQRCFVYNSPSQLAHFMNKRNLFSFVLQPCLRFCYSLLVLNYNSLLLLNKVILLVNNWLFHFLMMTLLFSWLHCRRQMA